MAGSRKRTDGQSATVDFYETLTILMTVEAEAGEIVYLQLHKARGCFRVLGRAADLI